MMKKLLATVVSLCMLAVLILFTPVNAATVPWSPDIEVKGTAQIGQTITVPPTTGYYDDDDNWISTGEIYYQLNLKAGQSVYFYQAPNADATASVRIYGNYADCRSEYLEWGSYYAVKDETVYVEFENSYDKNASVTIQAGQVFNKTVTKEDGRGNNCYFYKPSVTGEYIFKVTSSDDDADPGLSIGMIKGGDLSSLKSRDCKWNNGYGYEEVTVTLQAGTQYAIYVYSDTTNPYTLSLVSAPAQPSVKVAKPKIKSVVSKKAKTAVVTWKKARGATGYQVTYSTKKNFKKAKSVTVSAKKTKATLKKLTKGKKYYVKVRTLKKVNGKTYSSSYSKTLSVKVK